mmetsp:Transcript_3294/g.8237  ORF Transcript_3294/g.8237 Transcript_3294/m.8237 type:complete len:243 (-) Transcript_3294:762-1490(-)
MQSSARVCSSSPSQWARSASELAALSSVYPHSWASQAAPSSSTARARLGLRSCTVKLQHICAALASEHSSSPAKSPIAWDHAWGISSLWSRSCSALCSGCARTGSHLARGPTGSCSWPWWCSVACCRSPPSARCTRCVTLRSARCCAFPTCCCCSQCAFATAPWQRRTPWNSLQRSLPRARTRCWKNSRACRCWCSRSTARCPSSRSWPRWATPPGATYLVCWHSPSQAALPSTGPWRSSAF